MLSAAWATRRCSAEWPHRGDGETLGLVAGDVDLLAEVELTLARTEIGLQSGSSDSCSPYSLASAEPLCELPSSVWAEYTSNSGSGPAAPGS
jgi:hypothetical protein